MIQQTYPFKDDFWLPIRNKVLDPLYNKPLGPLILLPNHNVTRQEIMEMPFPYLTLLQAHGIPIVSHNSLHPKNAYIHGETVFYTENPHRSTIHLYKNRRRLVVKHEIAHIADCFYGYLSGQWQWDRLQNKWSSQKSYGQEFTALYLHNKENSFLCNNARTNRAEMLACSIARANDDNGCHCCADRDNTQPSYKRFSLVAPDLAAFVRQYEDELMTVLP